MIKDFSHELSDTQQHVEQMVQQMMTSLANIRLARLTIDMVQYYTLLLEAFYIPSSIGCS